MNTGDDVTIVVGGGLCHGRFLVIRGAAFTVAIGPHRLALYLQDEGVHWLRGKWNAWDSRGRALLTAYTLRS